MQPIWINRYDAGVPHTLDYPDWTAFDLLRRSAEKYPSHSALIFHNRRISYSELEELSTKFALALQVHGVQPGDRVALMLPNIPQAIIAYYGTLKAGALVVHMHPQYVAPEIVSQLVDSDSETIVTLNLLYSRIRPVFPQTPLRRVILTGIQDFLPPLQRFLYTVKSLWDTPPRPHVERLPAVYSFLNFLNIVRAVPEDKDTILPSVKSDDIALLQYTGGTNGVLKGAMLSHRNVVANTLQCRAWVPDFQEGKEVFLGVVPFFHAYGLSTTQHLAIMTGGSQVLLPRFQVADVVQAIQRYSVTIFSGIPSMFMLIHEFHNVGRFNLRSLRVCLSGASPLHEDIQCRFEELTGVRIAEGYGLTEASPVTHCNLIYGHNPPGSIGVPIPDTECRIVDLKTGERDLPVGRAGELIVRGPQVMQGYWRNTRETQAALRNGWLYTGDIARTDQHGFFFLTNRKKDMIKSRGENVYPHEVENILLHHQAVKDTLVVGIPHRKLGEAIKAYVVLKEGQHIKAHALIKHCREFLASYKTPSIIEFQTQLPRHIAGKAFRRTMRKKHMTTFALIKPVGEPRKAG
ncbi:MAG: long-chain-fatty-acid--CoA ligase [Nitrospirales bacterium]|nr:MAG: long-chain-fatty-acid--CoA ligase [Nitrospirales bacterium]